MKHISDLTILPSADTRQPRQNETASKVERLSTNLTDRLWSHMIRIYGHRFTSSYGEVDDGTWAKALAGITPEQLGRGLSQCMQREGTWPPTLPEFRAMCVPPKPYHGPVYVSLPAPPADPATAREWMKKIKAQVGLA